MLKVAPGADMELLVISSESQQGLEGPIEEAPSDMGVNVAHTPISYSSEPNFNVGRLQSIYEVGSVGMARSACVRDPIAGKLVGRSWEANGPWTHNITCIDLVFFSMQDFT